MESASISVPAGPPWDEARAIHRTLRAGGAEAWFVGGCVRDLLLARPVKDIDIATDAPPERVEQLFERTIAVGKSFGVIIVVTPTGGNVEVATFRSDGAYIDGRRPTTVVFSDARSDVERRDFTINGLLLDPDSGQVVDHVGGLADLSARRLRAVGDAAARLREDRLRVLRGMRFAAGLGLEIDSSTWDAMRATPLTGLSAERIVQEWFKGLDGGNRGRWLGLLADSGRLGEFTPPLAPALVAETQRRLDRLASGTHEVGAAVWLSQVAVKDAVAWLDGLPLEKGFLRRLAWLLEQLSVLPSFAQTPLPERRRLAQHAQAPQLLEAARACRPDDPATDAFAAALTHEASHPRGAPLVRAADLLALGMTPGPRLGELLRRLDDAQLEERFTSREQALEQARAWLPRAP